jgi:putative membrane protein
MLGAPSAALAHAVGDAAAGLPGAPWLWPLMLGTLVVWAVGLSRLWTKAGVGTGVRPAEAASFAAGWVVLAAALLPPIDPLGTELFWVHMVQHELLMLGAAPLLVLGRPLATLVWGVPGRWRRAVAEWPARTGLARGVGWLTRPLVAWSLHAAVLWGWHVPALFELSVRDDAVHELQHASFFVSALLFWDALCGPGARRRQRAGAGLLYLFTTLLHTSVLGALLTFSTQPWYPVYEASAPAHGLTALQDQQLGGLIMWVPGGVVYMVATLALLGTTLARAAPALALAPSPALARSPAPEPAPTGGSAATGTPSVAGGRPATPFVPRIDPGADPARIAVQALRAHGCVHCHRVPGVAGGHGRVGPPLERLAGRVYVAGGVPNDEDALVRFVVSPPSVRPGSGMPITGITEPEARAVVRWLLDASTARRPWSSWPALRARIAGDGR